MFVDLTLDAGVSVWDIYVFGQFEPTEQLLREYCC